MPKYCIFSGNCIDSLKNLEDNSISAIITDPPYGLSKHTQDEVKKCMKAWINDEPYHPKGKGFMGKDWDAWVPGPEVWKECLRVLKPGGHILVFAGTRSMDLMSMAIRLSGFELRDKLMWVYGSGFPKSLSVDKSLNAMKIKNEADVEKEIDMVDKSGILRLWKEYLETASNAGLSFQRRETAIGTNMQKSDFVPVPVLQLVNPENKNAAALVAELSSREAPHMLWEKSIVLKNADKEEKQDLVKSAELLQPSDQARFTPIGTVQGVVKDWQNESREIKLKAVEVLKTWLGKNKSLNKVDTSVLCVALTEDLRHIILSQSKIFQSYDTTQKMDCVFAINVTITEYMAESLISFMVDTVKNELGGFVCVEPDPITEAAKRYDGWGTALKPAYEPIIIARKPLEGTVAANVLKYGTGGINIDGCRVGTEDNLSGGAYAENKNKIGGIYGKLDYSCGGV
jgi:hypothetical protein